MSNTLLIRHLCADLEVSEREDFLKHFGADKVWFINPKSHTVFASFKSKQTAEEALNRLHQLEILGKRLTVEYAEEGNNKRAAEFPNKDLSDIAGIKKFVDELNSCDAFLNFNQPPPPNLQYKYPSPTSHILFNILYSLAKNLQFYVQTLHLMNKMNLDPPFNDINDEVKEFAKESIVDLDLQIPCIKRSTVNELSSGESEMASEEDATTEICIPKPIKRRKLAKKINKMNNLQQNLLLSNQHSKKVVNSEEIFEKNTISRTKAIKINLDPSQAIPSEDPVEIVGSINKIDIPKPPENSNSNEETSPCETILSITLDEISNNKLSPNDMKILPVFKNYNAGSPSMRLYIKNLAKGVSAQDIEAIYKLFLSDNSEENKMFDVRVMQEGRMKGQGFVTFPNIEISQTALTKTNGFIFKNKPLVVQFARSAYKKE